MKLMTNSELAVKNARNADEAGKIREERKIKPVGTSFGGKGNTSNEAILRALDSAVRRQAHSQWN